MNIDLTKESLKYINRGLTMLENSNNRKLKQEDMSDQIKTIVTAEQVNIYALKQQISQHSLNFKEDTPNATTPPQQREQTPKR